MTLESTANGKPAKTGKKNKAPSSSSSMQECPGFCEGWLEKYSLGRSMFSSKGWHKRYFFLSKEGLGYAHKNPREDKRSGAREPPATLVDDGPSGTPQEQKANLRYNLFPYKKPIKASAAKCFIPFERKLTTPADGQKVSVGPKEAVLQPVYFLENVEVAQHPEVSATCRNGICCEKADKVNGGLHLFSSNGKETNSYVPGGEPMGEASYFYYFAVSFEEKKKRFLLMLRTPNVQVYLKFKYYLRMYTHEASRYSLIPVAHPLEVNKAVPTDVNKKRITNSGGADNHETAATTTTVFNHSTSGNTFNITDFTVGGSAMQLSYYRDPDPCTAEEMGKIKKFFFDWNDGARERVLSTRSGELATLVRLLALPIGECENEVQQLRRESPEVYYQTHVLDTFSVLGPDVPEEEYEKDNKEALDSNSLSASGYRNNNNNNGSSRSNLNNDSLAPYNNTSGTYQRFSPSPNGGTTTHANPQANLHNNNNILFNGNANGKAKRSGGGGAVTGNDKAIYSDASADDEDDDNLSAANVRKPAAYTAVHTNTNQNYHYANGTQLHPPPRSAHTTPLYTSPNINGVAGTPVVVADRREPVQDASSRNRIIISSSLGGANEIDEGSGLLLSR